MRLRSLCAWMATRAKEVWTNHIHFIQLHYFYILFLILFVSALYYCETGTDWQYIDALFMATTGSTNTGLNTLPISSFSTYQLILLFFSSFFGSHVGISLMVVLVRKRFFSKRFDDILLYNKARRMREEHRRRRQRDENRGSTSARPSAPIHLRKLRRSSTLSTAQSQPSQSSGNQAELAHPLSNTPAPASSGHTKIDMWPNAASDSMSSMTNGNTIHAADEIDKDPSPSPFELRRVNTSPPAILSASSTAIASPLPMHPNEDHHGDDDSHENDGDDEGDGGMDEDPQGTSNENTGIAFADDIDQQRVLARHRLEQDRRFRDTLDKLTQASETEDENLWRDALDAEDEMDSIMREPIDKSQLTREQRYRLGGAEYRALDVLVRLVPIYYIGIVVIFAFGFRIYIAASPYAQNVLLTSNGNGPVDPWFFSFFQSLSAFNNLGIMLIDASMVPFQNAPAPLILTMLLILLGNTAYAIMLRFIIWSMYKLTPRSHAMQRETLQYLLDHPRRVYTTLFPSTQTYWLLSILIIITLVELASFLALNYWLPVLAGIPWASRFIDGLFQSVSTRNAGFAVISLGDLNPGTQLVYIVAMYISVYPVAISMRNSNVYQERALGIYRTGEDGDDDGMNTNIPDSGPTLLLKLKRHPTMTSVITNGRKALKKPDFFVVQQVQRQLSNDISWLIVCLFIIVVAEAGRIMDPSPITVWTIIYECVSAFGNIGASPGYPNTSVSQSGEYRVISKLVIIFLMYKGRHRGLPASIDRAVMLPSDQLEDTEAEEQIFKRRMSYHTPSSHGGASSIRNANGSLDNIKIYQRTETF